MNSSEPGTDAAGDLLYRRLLLPSYIASLCVSLVALLSLVFTLWIFARKRDATAGARGMVLLIVTGLFTALSLTVLHVSSIRGLTAAAAGLQLHNSTAAVVVFEDAQYIVTNTSLLLRNWWVTFLTGIRFIVILFPLHVPEILTRRRQSVAFGLILCLSAAISVVRHVEEKACNGGVGDFERPGLNSTTSGNLSAANLPPTSMKACERFILFFFVMQTGIPVPAVLVLSVALAVHLIAAREPADAAAAASSGVRRSDSTVSSNVVSATSVAAVAAYRQQSSSTANNRGRDRKRKATRILLVLAATFTVLELPTFVYFIMLHFFPSFRSSSQVKGQLIFSGFNALITLDTLANFFIFFVFSESFKREVKCFVSRRLRGCGGRVKRRQRLGGDGLTCVSNGADAGITLAPVQTHELYPLRSDSQTLDRD